MSPDFGKSVLCIGHVPPLYSLEDAPLLFISESDLGVPDSWVYGDEYPDLLDRGGTLSEYAGLFAVCRKMRKEGRVPTRLILTQYRKFVTHQELGTTAQNMPYLKTVPGAGLKLLRKDIEPVRSNTLVTRPFDLKMRVLDQYSKVHVLRDLLAFVSDSISRGVINNAEAKDLLDSRFMIPAPTLGCYDGDTFMEIFGALERAAIYFLARSYQPRAGYQRRVLGFCLERLHSHLLLRRLGFPNLQSVNFGWQVVVSDTANVQPTV